MSSSHPFLPTSSHLSRGPWKTAIRPYPISWATSTGPIMSHFPPPNTDFLPSFVNAHIEELVALYDCVSESSLFYLAHVLHMRRAMQHRSSPSSTFSNPRSWKMKRRIQEYISGSCLSFVYFKCTGSRTVCATCCEMMQTLTSCRSTK